ncbi:MAG: hypothetical protein WCK11_05070 [Candidatus Falkowbacteria bacterium]
MIKVTFHFSLGLVAIIFLLVASPSKAATLYFGPESGEYGYGDTFGVDVKIDLDSGEECINTVQAVIDFDKNYLDVVDFSTGDSILSLWLLQPKTEDMTEINHTKRLSFTGGIPGGYCGKIPGDPGESNILGKIIFKVNNYNNLVAPAPVAKALFLASETKVLLNDGVGSEANLSLKEGKFTIAAAKTEPKKEWEQLRAEDNVTPEPFVIEIQQNAEIYGGKNYLLFTTTDKQTGIDHYEILESAPVADTSGLPGWLEGVVGFFKQQPVRTDWVRANSPYILHDQNLHSDIKVKAVDKAGNERIAEYLTKEKAASNNSLIKVVVFVVLLLIIVGLVGYLRFRRRR